MGDAGSCSIVVESFETEDFSALVWLRKSCFAELTTSFASLRICVRSVCSVERALSLSWTFLTSSTDTWRSATFSQ